MLNRIIILISLLILIKIVFSEIDKIDINDQIQVIIQNNTYIGFKNTVLGQNVNSFLGIPYAQPPVGSLRFKKPLPTVQNYGTIDATKFRNCCPQRKQGLFGNSSPQSEDCLYLNIWNSGDDIDLTELKPVMLYIHGGGWLEGESSNGSILAVTGDVVVVTINYRLGFIGFLYTGTDDAPGNAGLWDQVLALEWVNDNIAYFGGDPKRITLLGESVGSRSTSIHILSPLTRSLFKNAIMMSGSSLSHLSHSEPEIVLNTSLVFSKLVGCNQNDEQFSPQVIECLKQLPLDELIEAQGSRLLWTQRFGFSSNYIHGDPILPETPYDMLNSGDYKKKINLLISTVEDEGTWILYRMDQNKYSRYDPINLTLEEAYEELKQLANSIDTTPPVNGEEVANLYFKNNKLAETSSYERLKTMGIALGDFFITCPTIKFAKKLFASAPDRHKIYQMYWSSKEGDYCGPWHGACHASDFEAVFGRAFERQSSEIEKQVSLRLMKVFAHFAKHDHPPPEDGQQWLSYHVEDRHNVMPYYEMSSQPKSSDLATLSLISLLSICSALTKTDVLPCVLESAFILRCSGAQITNAVLKTVGPKISTTTPIDIFTIYNTSLTEIGANTFPNVDFKNIEIEDNANLVKVDPKAFRSPATQVVSSLQFNNNKKFADNTIYELTRTLRLSDAIHLNGNALTEIPSHAFATNVTSKRDLQLITITDNKLTRIYSDAFNGVPELKRINLLGNKINRIDENGLRFDALDYATLQINLAYNELSEKSLVANSIAIPKNTAITVLFEANQFTTLDEAVFKHLLDNGQDSEFYFASSMFNCNCSMKWLLELTNANRHFGDISCASNDNSNIYSLNVTDLKC